MHYTGALLLHQNNNDWAKGARAEVLQYFVSLLFVKNNERYF
jgi:hypothetical protein